MPARGKASAYLVIPFALEADGMWVKEAETICFDRDLAIEIAKADSRFTAGVGVYPLDQDGNRLTAAPIAWYGGVEAPQGMGSGMSFPPPSGILVDQIAAGPRQVLMRDAVQIH